MKFVIKHWTLETLYKLRNKINFPVYQRGKVWSEYKNELLIDSIIRGIDIPKIYLQKTKEGWDVIDGQQRIKAILGFFDEEFSYKNEKLAQLDTEIRNKIEDYELTIAEIQDVEIDEEELRDLFLRLQLGVPTNAGEKLNAIKSNLGEFVKKMSNHPFIKNISIPSRRFGKEQICAQICNNSKIINKTGEFRSSKYEDLENLYRWNKNFDLESTEAKFIMSVLDKLNDIFSEKAAEIRSRAATVSIYLLVEEMMIDNSIIGKEEKFRKFYIKFLEEIKKEIKKGFDAKNRFLIDYQSKIIQGADSKSSIEFRHNKLKDAFNYYLEQNKIIGSD
jgi:uncharacterized protein with ParB-like and HNH nuclease domain